MRAEQFAGYKRINNHLPEKFFTTQADSLKMFNVLFKKIGLPKVKDVREASVAHINIIPSIPELEVLPNPLPEIYKKNKLEYVGPLMLPDREELPHELLLWMKRHKKQGKKIILSTISTSIKRGDDRIYNWLISTLGSLDNFASIIIIPNTKIFRNIAENIKKSGKLKIISYTNSLSKLLDNVDIAVHHGGHAFIFSCLLSLTPMIVIPASEYDREDNAVRLEKNGVCKRLTIKNDTVLSADLIDLINTMIDNEEIKKCVKIYQEKIRRFIEHRNVSLVESLIQEHLYTIGS